jgi:hypothetical protein
MTHTTRNQESFTLTTDGTMFSMGFAVGLIIGKLLLRNTLLAVAFATGLGLAVGTSADMSEAKDRIGDAVASRNQTLTAR